MAATRLQVSSPSSSGRLTSGDYASSPNQNGLPLVSHSSGANGHPQGSYRSQRLPPPLEEWYNGRRLQQQQQQQMHYDPVSDFFTYLQLISLGQIRNPFYFKHLLDIIVNGVISRMSSYHGCLFPSSMAPNKLNPTEDRFLRSLADMLDPYHNSKRYRLIAVDR